MFLLSCSSDLHRPWIHAYDIIAHRRTLADYKGGQDLRFLLVDSRLVYYLDKKKILERKNRDRNATSSYRRLKYA
jgi:hypothetical protein